MGILKSIDKRVEKAKEKYQKAKEDTKNIRKTGSKVLDFIIPPKRKIRETKTKQKRKEKTTTYKSGNITCTCKSK